MTDEERFEEWWTSRGNQPYSTLWTTGKSAYLAGLAEGRKESAIALADKEGERKHAILTKQLAVEEERERCAEIALNCWGNGQSIAAAIRGKE